MVTFEYKLLLLRLLPETILIVGALLVLFLDQANAKSWSLTARSSVASGLAALTLVLGILAVSTATEGEYYDRILVISSFGKIVKSCILVLALASILISPIGRFTSHVGEYAALILFATIGLLLLATTEELLTAFISLELTSLSLYLLTAFNKESIISTEAALKYFLFGSVAAAFTLFGISLIFGLSGSTTFAGIAQSLRTQELNPLLILALVLTAAGFAFKMAAAPLHLWAPDAYQGAPVPSAALIASGSKLASLFLFLKLFVFGFAAQAGSAAFQGASSGWMLAIAAIAATSMILGNVLAIAQSNVRRLIAYSAIAHAGYALIAVLARSETGAASAVYHMFTYGLAVVGVFAVIGVVEQRHGELTLSDLRGLSRRSPLVAICLLVFVLSLAGIPPLAGFFGKFYVFLAALDASKTEAVPGLLWIVVLAVATSAVSLYYYLQILKQAFVLEADSASSIIRIPGLRTAAVALLAAAIVLLGCFPNLLVSRLHAALPPVPLIEPQGAIVTGH